MEDMEEETSTKFQPHNVGMLSEGPHWGVYQGWHIAQPLSQGCPASGVCEVASQPDGYSYFATWAQQATGPPTGAHDRTSPVTPSPSPRRMADSEEAAEEAEQPRQAAKKEGQACNVGWSGSCRSARGNCRDGEPAETVNKQAVEAGASSNRQKKAATQQQTADTQADVGATYRGTFFEPS